MKHFLSNLQNEKIGWARGGGLPGAKSVKQRKMRHHFFNRGAVVVGDGEPVFWRVLFSGSDFGFRIISSFFFVDVRTLVYFFSGRNRIRVFLCRLTDTSFFRLDPIFFFQRSDPVKLNPD